MAYLLILSIFIIILYWNLYLINTIPLPAPAEQVPAPPPEFVTPAAGPFGFGILTPPEAPLP
jgi:hypothetical protein